MSISLHPSLHKPLLSISLSTLTPLPPPRSTPTSGWHDIAGAITHKGVHHIYQGTGWNHALSSDLVHWKTGSHGPAKIHETHAGMDSTSDPCSGFITKDPEDSGRVCAGFRQCGSNKGVAGGKPWDVPLELRCALDDNMTSWSTEPEYVGARRREYGGPAAV